MMKIFDAKDRINFVDENNVFVGFEKDEKCCEYISWYISKSRKIRKKEEDFFNDKDKKKENQIEEGINLNNYVFDKKFIEKGKKESFDEKENDLCYVTFRLKSKNDKNIYLHLINIHNGYYIHDFEFKDKKYTIKKNGI